MVVDGKKVAAAILEEARLRLKALRSRRKVKLAVVLVGADKPSETYVREKGLAAQKLGIEFALHRLPESIATPPFIRKIKKIQRDKDLSGLIVQLPLPAHIDSREVINAIRPELDADCLTNICLGKILRRTSVIAPPAAAAVISILDHYLIRLRGAAAVIVGAGDLVGRPLSIMLLNEGATVTVCNRSTKNLADFTRRAEILVSAVGKKDLINGSMVKKGAVVLDAGFNVIEGKIYGDVNFTSVSKKAKLITPTPGGIGPVTVAHLLLNTVKNAQALLGVK